MVMKQQLELLKGKFPLSGVKGNPLYRLIVRRGTSESKKVEGVWKCLKEK